MRPVISADSRIAILLSELFHLGADIRYVDLGPFGNAPQLAIVCLQKCNSATEMQRPSFPSSHHHLSDFLLLRLVACRKLSNCDGSRRVDYSPCGAALLRCRTVLAL